MSAFITRIEKNERFYLSARETSEVINTRNKPAGNARIASISRAVLHLKRKIKRERVAAREGGGGEEKREKSEKRLALADLLIST